MKAARSALLATLLTFLLLFAAASLRYQGFFASAVVLHLFDDNAFLGIASVGMSFVILTGGIDLSVGSMIGFTSILSAKLIERGGWSPLWALVAVLALGTLLGWLMGYFISAFELAPFLVTLAGMFFLRGLAYAIGLESVQLEHPFFQKASEWRFPFTSLSLNSSLFLGSVVLAAIVASFTRFGRTTYALGGNELSARLMGLAVDRCKRQVYALSGFCSALAGIVYTLYTSSGNSTAAIGLELDAIAAVVIGGTLLTGGSGHPLGTLIGVLILGVIQTAITFEATLSSWWTRIAVGTLLFVFIVLQRLLAPRAENRA